MDFETINKKSFNVCGNYVGYSWGQPAWRVNQTYYYSSKQLFNVPWVQTRFNNYRFD